MLVPFVERVPFVDRFPALQSLAIDMGAGSTATPGREATVSRSAAKRDEARVAAAICYEYLYPDKVADLSAKARRCCLYHERRVVSHRTARTSSRPSRAFGA